jgi:acyl-CoA dehydrogenase
VAVETYLDELRAIVEAVNATNDPALGWSGVRLGEALDSLKRATQWMLAMLDKDANQVLAGATPYLRLFSITAGGCLLAQQALAALRLNNETGARVTVARFFAENIAVQAGALERTVVEGGGAVLGAEAALAE